MNAALFDVLAGCNTWTDSAVFGATDERPELIRDLAESGLIEVR
jgi:hypothetical protein